MADKNSGWLCTATAAVVAETNTTATIEVTCYWKNNNWRYDINFVSAWVYKDGTAQQIMNSGSVDSTSSYTASVKLGSYRFTVNKTTSAQSIPCCAKITTESSYVKGTKWSGDIYVTVAAKPSYTVSYNANGGSGGPGNQTKWYDTNLTLSSSIPSRAGHSFVRWNTNTNNTGTGYAPGATYTGNAGLTLYAIWTAHTYTVQYNANGGSGAPGNQTKTYGVNLTLSSTIPTRPNYNFLGWSASPNGGVDYNAGGPYINNSGITLYAVWQLAYQKPRITNFNAHRCDSAGNASETGTYLRVKYNWSTDYNIVYSYVDWTTDPNWSTWSSKEISVSGTSNSVDVIVGDGNISTETSYYVRSSASDGSGDSLSTVISIGTVKFPIDVKAGGTGVAIGKVAEKDAFEVAMDMYDKNGGPIISDRLTKTITITGDSNTYYPVRISASAGKDKPQTVSVWKNLGSPTASYPGNHSNGTSSLWLIYECRHNGWDGNGGYIKTKYKYEGYATLVAHTSMTGSAAGDLVVWLRGGGTEYNISCDNNFDVLVYYSDTNIGTSDYPSNVGPVTEIGNGGIQSSTYIGYGDITGNAYSATYASNSTGDFNAAWNVRANNGFLCSVANGNTVKIGSQNSGYCHIYNSADIPFYFNKDIMVNGYTLAKIMAANIVGNAGNTSSYVQLGTLKLCWGKINITPVANSPTSGAVTFPLTYSKNPAIIVTAETGSPGAQVKGYAASNITTTGFNAYVNRTNTTVTSIIWFAIGE